MIYRTFLPFMFFDFKGHFQDILDQLLGIDLPNRFGPGCRTCDFFFFLGQSAARFGWDETTNKKDVVQLYPGQWKTAKLFNMQVKRWIAKSSMCLINPLCYTCFYIQSELEIGRFALTFALIKRLCYNSWSGETF